MFLFNFFNRYSKQTFDQKRNIEQLNNTNGQKRNSEISKLNVEKTNIETNNLNGHLESNKFKEQNQNLETSTMTEETQPSFQSNLNLSQSTKNSSISKAKLESNDQKEVIDSNSQSQNFEEPIFQNIEINQLRRTKNTGLPRRKSRSIEKAEFFLRGRSQSETNDDLENLKNEICKLETQLEEKKSLLNSLQLFRSFSQRVNHC